MTDIVHWKEIVDRHFGDMALFTKITKAMMFCHRTNIPVSKAFDKLDLHIQEKYDLTRWHMRKHGWFSGYVEGDGLKFLCTVDAPDRQYITLSRYLDRLQSQGIEDMVDEYYQTRDVIDHVSAGLSEPHKRKDIYDAEGGFID
jgi:hypothetical protein